MLTEKLSRIDRRLIAAAAAIAAGCKPCTANTIAKAREAGATDKEIIRALKVALAVRHQASQTIRLEAERHLHITSHKSSPEDAAGKTKSDWLIATSAAFAANFTAGFERYSTAAEQLRASESEFKTTLQISRYVKEQAAHQVNKAAAMVTPNRSIEEDVVSGCGCRPDCDEGSTTKHS